MARSFNVELKADPEVVIAKARATAQRHGGSFDGDRFAGRFSGNGVQGAYRIDGDTVHITIESKPELAAWPIVEQAVRGFFDVAEERGARRGEAEARTSGAEAGQREQRAEAIVRKHVLWSTGAGLIPIPIADLAAVTAIQVSMLEDLARLYGADYSETTIRSFITGLTGSTLARLGASMIKAIPGVGSIIGGISMPALSGASTYAVGQVSIKQLQARGGFENVDLEQAKRAYQSEFESGKGYVADLEKQAKAAPSQPASTAPGAAPSADPLEDVFVKLERLGELRDKGVLTDEEFERKKKELLDKV